MAENELKKSNQPAWWQPAIIMFLKLSVWIAAPIIIALYLGEWLDKKYNSEPWLFLVCIGIAFTISIIGLVINTIRELKKIDK
ncbi:MAG: AtpZ/AtpI family protein [bacterium]